MNALIVNDLEKDLPESFMKSWLSELKTHLLNKQISHEDKLNREISLVFLKEGEAKRLNWQYRGKDYATDILSFETEDETSFGELVFCWDVLQKQAKEHKLTIEHELGYLIIHGILHLLGYDHEVPGPKAEEMLKIQDDIFAQMTTKAKKKTTAKKAAPAKAAKKAVVKKAAVSAKAKAKAKPKAKAKSKKK